MRKTEKANLYRKLVSLILMIGGGAGFIVAAMAWIAGLTHRAAAPIWTVALMGLFVLVFGLTMWTGVELWRKKPRALIWAQILLIAQVPNLSVAGFVYQFYTAFPLYLSWSQRPDVVIGFEFHLGSNLTFQFGSETDGFILGVNLVAIGALYLLEKARASLEPNAAAAVASPS